jgi:hypothetical protein
MFLGVYTLKRPLSETLVDGDEYLQDVVECLMAYGVHLTCRESLAYLPRKYVVSE